MKRPAASVKNEKNSIHAPLPDETHGLPAKAEQIMSDVTIHGDLTIATVLYDLVNDEILAGTNIKPADFWNGFDQAAHQLAPKNQRFWKQGQGCKTTLITG